MHSLYIGRKPILDKENNIGYYKLLYARQEESEGFVFDTLLVETLQRSAEKGAFGGRKAFLELSADMLGGREIFELSKEHFVLTVAALDEIEEWYLRKIAKLKEEGYAIALDGFVPRELYMQRYEELLKSVSFVKICVDDEFVVDDESRGIVGSLLDRGITCIASDVNDTEKFSLCENLGCELFEGYYFLNASFFKDVEPAASKSEILRLYSMLSQESPLDDIAQEFNKSASISFLLLKYINSGAFHFKNRISSIRHILTLVGREPLLKWLMMVMYSSQEGASHNMSSLMSTVKCRTELMESVLRSVVTDIDKTILNQGYFVSVLSLADVLFGEDMQTMLEELNVYDVVRSALLHKQGVLGEVYALITDIEKFDTERIAEFENRYELEEGAVSEIFIEAMCETAAFEKALSLAE